MVWNIHSDPETFRIDASIAYSSIAAITPFASLTGRRAISSSMAPEAR